MRRRTEIKHKIALRQDKDYYNPIAIGKNKTLLEKVSYGGDDSESVPCGFNSEWITKKNIKNLSRKRKDMRNALNKIARKAIVVKNSGSLQPNNKR